MHGRQPILEEDQGGVRVTFRKNIYTETDLTNMGLNQRQVKAVLIAKEKGYITLKINSFEGLIVFVGAFVGKMSDKHRKCRKS